MSATVLSSPAGTARQLQSGGWAVHVGDLVPTWVKDREAAWDLLAVHASTDSPAGQPTTPVVGHPRTARPGPTPAEVRP